MVNQTITYKIMAQIKFQWRSPIYIVNAFQKNIRSVGQDRYYHYYLYDTSDNICQDLHN